VNTNLLTITEAAQAGSVYGAALGYAWLGISVIPLVGKIPTIRSWKRLQMERASLQKVADWERTGILLNVGIVCGSVSHLVVVDLDGPNAVATFEAAFPELLDTYTVKTGSGQGKHIYLRPYTMPSSLEAKDIPGGGNIELRANGRYVVAPPSVHPDTGQQYTVCRARPVLQVPNLTRLERWIRELNRPTPPPAKGSRLPTIVFSRSYGRAALEGELRNLAAAPEGSRNNRLNGIAYKLGGKIARGYLSVDEVESALLTGAVKLGLSDREALATIRSGLQAGMRKARL
jgi:hypothetical protein